METRRLAQPREQRSTLCLAGLPCYIVIITRNTHVPTYTIYVKVCLVLKVYSVCRVYIYRLIVCTVALASHSTSRHGGIESQRKTRRQDIAMMKTHHRGGGGGRLWLDFDSYRCLEGSDKKTRERSRPGRTCSSGPRYRSSGLPQRSTT